MVTSPSILVFPTRFARGWPAHACGEAPEITEAAEAFTTVYGTDGHFTGYELAAESPRRRLTLDALAALPVPPSMVWFVADVDAPAHASTDEWRDVQRTLSRYVPGNPFGYFTRGGARLVWRLERRPIVDGDEWSRFYLLGLVALAALSGIVADPACHDWTRLYRLPHATRDGVLQQHGWICGDPAAIGAWTMPEISPADLAATLGWLESISPAWARRASRLFPPPERPVRAFSGTGDASRAIRWAADRVANHGQGDRNTELFRRARWLRGLVERGELAAADVERAMFAAGLASGLTEREARRTIASALRGAA